MFIIIIIIIIMTDASRLSLSPRTTSQHPQILDQGLPYRVFLIIILFLQRSCSLFFRFLSFMVYLSFAFFWSQVNKTVHSIAVNTLCRPSGKYPPPPLFSLPPPPQVPVGSRGALGTSSGSHLGHEDRAPPPHPPRKKHNITLTELYL